MDGADMDWEAPLGPTEVQNYAAFLKLAKQAFEQQQPPLMLTMAVHPEHAALLAQHPERADLAAAAVRAAGGGHWASVQQLEGAARGGPDSGAPLRLDGMATGRVMVSPSELALGRKTMQNQADLVPRLCLQHRVAQPSFQICLAVLEPSWPRLHWTCLAG